MPETDIGSADYGDLTSTMEDYSVENISIEEAQDRAETAWINTAWPEFLGKYKLIPELQAAIDAKATWTVGKGFMAEETTTIILDTITGWGKETFNTILEDAIRTYQIGGDAFLEIVRDKEGNLINIKSLNPENIKIVVNRKGRIKRYEQINRVKKTERKFKPEEMLHFARNRVANEIHGVSLIKSVEKIILMRNEAMDDWKRVLHRNVDPLWIFHLDTDDPAKIAAFKTMQMNARKNGECMFIPKGAVVPELISTATNASLSPLSWIKELNNYFFQATGVPQIIVGGSEEFTEATAKIAYLAFQQTIEEEQLFLEEQILAQLNIEIQLEFPASLENEMLSGQSKSETMQASTPEDTSVREKGVKNG